MDKPNPSQQPQVYPHIEGMDRAPEIVVDGVQGLLYSPVFAKLNMFTDMPDPNGGMIRRVPAARLVMTVPNLVAIHALMGNIIADLRKQGAIVDGPNEGDTVQ